jgi:dipeptidyl aminopeptidase/acylaminoacyl peptidase
MSDDTSTCEQLSIASDGIDLAAAVHLPAKVPAPVIVCSHGLVSSKQSPKFIAIGEEMSKAGFCVLRFDFSGCGDTPPRASLSLVEGRRRDLWAAVDFALNQPWSDGRIGLFGSSFGGFLSLLAAEENLKLIRAAVSWAAPFDMGAIHPDSADLRELLVVYGEDLTLGSPSNLAGLGQASRVLVIHGQMDEIVPWKDAVQIYERLKDPRKLFLMRTADHKVSEDSWRKLAIRESLEWFLTFLG